MKKIVFVSIALFLIAGASHGQNEKFFRFGLHGNTGMVWMKPDQDSLEFQGTRMGLGYGFIGEMTIANNFSFATGFDVSYVGGKLQKAGVYYAYPPNDTLSSNENSTYKLQYLDIPLTLKMKTNEINYITYFARIGGSIGIALKAKADREYNVIGSSNSLTIQDIDLVDEKKFMRTNFLIGAGLEYSLGGTTSALAEISFVNGLTYLIDDTKAIGNYVMLKFGIIF